MFVLCNKKYNSILPKHSDILYNLFESILYFIKPLILMLNNLILNRLITSHAPYSPRDSTILSCGMKNISSHINIQ